MQIPEWTRNVDFMRHISILKQFTHHADNDIKPLTDENINRSKLYMQSVNNVIKDRSDKTAVTFMYLTAPPKINSPDWEQRSAHYLDLITELTSDLPPTILVHGINAVTSTTL